MRHEQIIDQAQKRSEMCTSQSRDIYRIAFKDGAEWADNSRNDFLPKNTERIQIIRNEDGKMNPEFRDILMSRVNFSNCVIAKVEEDDESYIVLLDPELCMQNDYEILNDFECIKEIIIIKKA